MNEPTPATPHPADELLRVAETVHSGEVSIAFKSGPTVLAKRGAKLLDIAEASQVPMESGCRMGMCGSDPVRILEGEENPFRDALGRAANPRTSRPWRRLSDGMRVAGSGAGRR